MADDDETDWHILGLNETGPTTRRKRPANDPLQLFNDMHERLRETWEHGHDQKTVLLFAKLGPDGEPTPRWLRKLSARGDAVYWRTSQSPEPVDPLHVAEPTEANPRDGELIDWHEAERLAGKSKATLKRYIAEGKLPKPEQVSERVRKFRRGEFMAALRVLIAQRT